MTSMTSKGFPLSRARRLLFLLWMLAAMLASPLASSAERPRNLLEGLSPSRASDVTNIKALTDGVSAVEGAEWDSTLAAIFQSEGSFVEFDLGEPTEIVAAYLQGDNNDRYQLTISLDGSTFVPLWTAPPVGKVGLRDRWSSELSGKGRWVRLSVGGGDQARSVSEVQLFAQRPGAMPPSMRRELVESHPAHFRTTLLYLIGAFGAFLFLTRAGAGLPRLLIAALFPLLAGGLVLSAIYAGWPLAPREVSFVRAAAATIALLAAIRGVVPGGLWPAHRGAISFALSCSAIMAFAAFYNLGQPQFFDHAHHRPEFVHTWDMRVYQPFAKYFEELQYDGVYDASVLAYAEDHYDGSLDNVGGQQVRGLRDHQIQLVRDVASEIVAIRTRFTAERWAQLKRDMRFFEDVMGPEFLSSLTDHGANATPVWVFFARMLLARPPASEGSLTLAGLVDGVLLLLMALALWRAFGLWPMLLAMTVFGATDIYMFGSNWTGATLRHDWLALLGFGACALKRQRWTEAGVCLGLSAMIRAFPLVALVGVALPAMWAIAEPWLRERKPPAWKSLLEEHAGAVRVLASAAACMLSLFLLTGLLYSFSSWVNWWHKVTLLNSEGSVNEISLRSLVSGEGGQASQHSRFLIYTIAQLGSMAAIAILARRRPLHQAMLLAMPLVWVISNPSNYYSHFVFLLALLASADGGPPARAGAHVSEEATVRAKIVPLRVPFLRVAFPLLALCIGGYWVSLDGDAVRHFQASTALLFVALGWLYTNLLRAEPRVANTA